MNRLIFCPSKTCIDRFCPSSTKMKYNITCAKFAVIDKVMIDTLRGEDTNPFSIFGGLYVNDEDLINHAHSENNMNLLEYIYLRRFILVSGDVLISFLTNDL